MKRRLDKTWIQETREQAAEHLKCSRRDFLKKTGQTGLWLSTMDILTRWGSLFQENEALAEGNDKCLVQLHLGGGACGKLLWGMNDDEYSDPRSQLSAYHRSFPNNRYQLVPGKSNIRVGPAWEAPALQALSNYKMIFCRGVSNPSAAHTIGMEAGLCGRQDLLQGTAQYASLARLVATEEGSDRFIKYANLGYPDYNGQLEGPALAARLAPGMATGSSDSFLKLLQGPARLGLQNSVTIQRIQSFVSQLNNAFFSRQRAPTQAAMSNLRTNSQGLFNFFNQNFGQVVNFNAPIPAQFGFAGPNPECPLWGPFMATLYLCLHNGVSRHLVVNTGEFDHHSDFDNQQLPSQREFTRALGRFLDRLRQSPIADKVYILITSDFTRLVNKNATDGTDHQIGANQMILSYGSLNDDQIVGNECFYREGEPGDFERDHGAPKPWNGIIPTHMQIAAALVTKMGYGSLVGDGRPFQSNPLVNAVIAA